MLVGYRFLEMVHDDLMRFEERGKGEPLVLVHGLGGTARSWDLLADELVRHRRLVVLNLPGHGGSPATTQTSTFDGLVCAVEHFLEKEGLHSADVVGSSLGGRIVLELAHRGIVRSAVALDPGGFWHGWETNYVFASLMGTIKLIRGLGRYRRVLAGRIARLAALGQLSHNPSVLSRRFVEQEIQGCADTSNFEAIARDLTSMPTQAGPQAGSVSSVAIGWGRQDRLCFPRQAIRAKVAFPGSTLHWFEECGHFPMWDQPALTGDFILTSLKNRNEK